MIWGFVISCGVGGLIGRLSPWDVNRWQFWAFTAPLAVGAGAFIAAISS